MRQNRPAICRNYQIFEEMPRLFSFLILLLFAVIGLSTGPAAATEFSATVRTIDEVAEGAMPQMTDVAATEAVLMFRSNTPLACSVVYGPTRDFGRVAVDADMDGGAHADHHPAITGLKPDTTYYFRVQGVAPDGTIYVGKVRSFRTLALSSGPVDQASLAAGARVGAVSSNYGGGRDDDPWGATSAIDGSRNTAWSSSGDGDNAFIEIEFAGSVAIGDVVIWSRSMSDGTARISKFTLTTDQGKVLGPFVLPDWEKPYRFDIRETARSLRLDVIESTGGNVGLIEFGVYAR